MKRIMRAALIVLAGLSPAVAQAPDSMRRIGALATSSEARLRSFLKPALETIGLVEGRNVVLDIRVGSPEEMPRLSQEIVAGKPRLIFASGGAAVQAAKSAPGTIPIVIFAADVVEQGVVKSLARPGANLTGIAILSRELNAKRLELLHEAVPAARRIAILVDPSIPLEVAGRREMSAAAAKSGIELLFFEASGPENYATAFDAMRAARADALAINNSPRFARDGPRLAQLARDAGLPTACEWREMADQGCFFSYGPNLTALYARVAYYVDRILKGAAPGDLPIEQPTRFEFVLNTKTAKALGLDLSPLLLTLADQVIE
jgi:putative ABC transport system substrate-binding protein